MLVYNYLLYEILVYIYIYALRKFFMYFFFTKDNFRKEKYLCMYNTSPRFSRYCSQIMHFCENNFR